MKYFSLLFFSVLCVSQVSFANEENEAKEEITFSGSSETEIDETCTNSTEA